MASASPQLEAEPTSKDDAAFWLYSSGSTGFPKGCVHLQHDMVACAETYAKSVLEITGSDRCFSVAKLFFAYGLGNAMYFPFSVGATAILWPGAPTAANVYWMIETYRPTLFFSVPTNFAMLLAHPRDGADFDLSSIRIAVSAGEALPAALFDRFKQRFGVEILDGIGSTEVLHIFISNRPGAIRPGSSGLIVPGYQARLVDEHNEPVPSGQIGNLLIRGDSTCSAYWNKHEKSKDAIEGHWIRTGDKYVQDEDSYFWYAGRSDDMLKVGGIWVSPVEVENALIEHPGVMECAVVGRSDHDEPDQARGVRRREGYRRGHSRSGCRTAAVGRGPAGGVQAPALDRIRARAAEDRDRKDSAVQAEGRRRPSLRHLTAAHFHEPQTQRHGGQSKKDFGFAL